MEKKRRRKDYFRFSGPPRDKGWGTGGFKEFFPSLSPPPRTNLVRKTFRKKKYKKAQGKEGGGGGGPPSPPKTFPRKAPWEKKKEKAEKISRLFFSFVPPGRPNGKRLKPGKAGGAAENLGEENIDFFLPLFDPR